MPKYHYYLIINEDKFKKVDDNKEVGSNFSVLKSATLGSTKGRRGLLQGHFFSLVVIGIK